MRVKICGVTSLEDARAALEAGADSIGLNFWPRSRRRCAEAEAARIAEALGERVRLVGVYVDASLAEIEAVRASTGVRWVQLHGDESPALFESLRPEVMKALRTTGPEVLDEASRFGASELLVDASVPGVPGGSGRLADWTLAAELARERCIWLAGGLSPDNVREAIEAVRPSGVDVASGVEDSPGRKSIAKMRAFVREARSAVR